MIERGQQNSTPYRNGNDDEQSAGPQRRRSPLPLHSSVQPLTDRSVPSPPDDPQNSCSPPSFLPPTAPSVEYSDEDGSPSAAKRPRLLSTVDAMQDHVGPTSSTSSSHHGSIGIQVHSRREGVASRLKKSLPSLSAHNGAVSPGSTAAAAAEQNGAASSPNRSPLELTQTDTEVVRLIGQHLKALGMHETVAALLREAGVKLENPSASRFRSHILSGNWEMVIADLKALQGYLSRPTDYLEMKFIIYEQQYMELLEKGQVVDALQVLRHELQPLQYSVERVHQLTTLLMCGHHVAATSTTNTANTNANGTHEARLALLHRLQAYLPPTVMLPPRRLECLLKQAIEFQTSQCPLHNSRTALGLDAQSLLVDHYCKRIGFPCETRQVLTDHCDEVWCAIFSHSGKYLATGSKESIVYVWEVDPTTKLLRKYRHFDGHQFGAAYFSWSPDDRYLAVVGAEDGPEVWIWDVEANELRNRLSHSPEDSLSTVSWLPDGRRIVCGGQKGQFYTCDLEGVMQSQWEGFRVRCLWCKKDGKSVLAADTHHRIRCYNFDTNTDSTVIAETDPLIYFCLDRTERYALCTTKGQGLHLWDLESKSLVRRYRGSQHGEYIVVSCFGGENEDFVATGSEDGKIYIWNRQREDPVKVLSGHASVVNAVSWNPADPSMLVSCSDDGTVRLWGPEGSSGGTILPPAAAAAPANDRPTTANNASFAFSGTFMDHSSMC